MSINTNSETNAKVAALNDGFRRSGCGITVTPGVQAVEDVPGLTDETRRYKEFAENNDPYGEHDFVAAYWFGQKVFWKINYYDQQLRNWCDLLSTECKRVQSLEAGR